jgi:hypothetical protein
MANIHRLPPVGAGKKDDEKKNKVETFSSQGHTRSMSASACVCGGLCAPAAVRWGSVATISITLCSRPLLGAHRRVARHRFSPQCRTRTLCYRNTRARTLCYRTAMSDELASRSRAAAPLWIGPSPPATSWNAHGSRRKPRLATHSAAAPQQSRPRRLTDGRRVAARRSRCPRAWGLSPPSRSTATASSSTTRPSGTPPFRRTRSTWTTSWQGSFVRLNLPQPRRDAWHPMFDPRRAQRRTATAGARNPRALGPQGEGGPRHAGGQDQGRLQGAARAVRLLQVKGPEPRVRKSATFARPAWVVDMAVRAQGCCRSASCELQGGEARARAGQ